MRDSGQLRCTLVQQILGLSNADICAVEADACRACNQSDEPDPARPNPVVSSLAYNLARTIRQVGGRIDCNIGQAWQAECYTRSTLAKDDVASAKPPFRQTPFRRSISANAVKCNAMRHRNGHSPAVGLVGYSASCGLGSLNRDLAEQGAIDSWLIPHHRQFEHVDVSVPGLQVVQICDKNRGPVARRWVKELDWVVWAETCPVSSVVDIARECGTRIACIPMWEWTSPNDEWLRSVDLLICPTRHAYKLFRGWKKRFGFHWKLAYFPWPVSRERFPFRLRKRCQSYLYVNGHGGARSKDISTGREIGARKGLDIVLAAAEQAPETAWTVYTQVEVATDPPANVTVLRGPVDSTALYERGDVCVQPSRWEGIGLPLLECQSAGMPLITVDAAPMNEYHPLRRLNATSWDWAYLTEGQPIPVPRISAESLAAVVRELQNSDILAASTAAHHWIRRERSWDQARARWRGLFSEFTALEENDVDRRVLEPSI
jgi:glycosyltransferase involved in cell wall biosynthesis